MRTIRATFLGIAGLALLAAPALAAAPVHAPNASHLSLQYPGAPRIQPDAPKSPYPMTYSDQVAQSLGVQNGRMDVFSTKAADPAMPSLSGGVAGDGAMVRLQWRP